MFRHLINVVPTKLSNSTLFVLVTSLFYIFFAFLFISVFGYKNYIVWDSLGHWHSHDDHMITQRVALNIWNAGQPFYNLNEPVAANTSLFWPYILSPIYAVFDSRTAIPVLILVSAMSYSITVMLACFGSLSLSARSVLFFFLILSPTTLAYAATGWEHIPQAFFFTVAALFLIQNRNEKKSTVPTTSLVLMAIAFLFRPDTAIAALIPGLFWVFEIFYHRKFGRISWLLLLLIFPILYLFLMNEIYGVFSPNTANLKLNLGLVSVISGLKYTVNPILAGPVPYLTLFTFFFWRDLTRNEKLLLGSIASYITYVVFVGGDAFASGRFFLFLLPSSSLLTFSVVTRKWPSQIVITGLVAIICTLGLHAPKIIKAGIREDVPFVQSRNSTDPPSERMRIAQVINQKISPDDGSIALHWLGIGYHMPDFHIVDFLGKAEPHIASLDPVEGLGVGHNKFDYNYAFSTYNIAAFPVDKYACDLASLLLNKGSKPDLTDIYLLSCFHALKTGSYNFISPEELGLTGPVGIVVRKDLIARFLD